MDGIGLEDIPPCNVLSRSCGGGSPWWMRKGDRERTGDWKLAGDALRGWAGDRQGDR